ncbi:MAG: bifunctional 2-polyprenyl-6-hydroxyphenol methylase/3-demethylubiquinol 3-O-methyltransferase UbiG [Gloeomargarita sp. SKYBB_i_bin120]|nr:bifunctional 2-polyprenyl-6-hydroxyphenol methylase/3-demethylubiquinol 3-O-methyltransferase UbiG [Gloeomargarita sp. SKYG98]MCS7292483.1 bifunctional 2-polyprenyl-6-hydroxyphenol methylase/3-demethylubiquinol 3-O-methyltransferase UbiG [Gloeomargarita sp. SKYB120]MDW8178044.1 bifunctional 2-polyprenyl-6-hydroxyphenol methylase/3-demethylubiquinol 3-O-methyltransferase UbiG [Gloeomargarita sp. SKYBB_i_bin120]
MRRNNLAYYDQHADQWWQPGSSLNLLAHLNPGRFQFFDQFVSDWRGVRVLDVGCGGGLTCEFLARRGALVSGVDPSAASIAVAREHAQRHGLSIDYRLGVGEALPYPDGTFQVVVCVDVLEHVQRVDQVVRECSRVLQPGGLFLFDTINRTWESQVLMIWLLEDVLRQIPPGIHDWEKFITPAELTQFLQQAGFENICYRGFDLTNGGDWLTLLRLLFMGLRRVAQQGLLKVRFNDNTRVMYIGKAVKGAGVPKP